MLKLVFTTQERRVFLFILATFLVGGALKLYHHYQLQTGLHPLDSLDREFLARVQMLPDSLADEPAAGSSASGASVAARQIDLNRADAGELELLNGIGPVLAERIVAYRRQHGPFNSKQDLLQIRGIGPRNLERIVSQITVGTKP